MDKFKAMEVFVRVVDLGGMTRAADAMDMPKATVSTLLQELEAQLGVRLLQRTTRRVTLTVDGAAYYERCVRILDDLREADEAVSSRHGQPEGRLKVDMPTALAALLMRQGLPDFLARYPGLHIEVGCTDRMINMVGEGVDCVLRVGVLRDPSLVARRVGELPLITVASPAYLRQHGQPMHPQQLQDHACVRYFVPGKADVWRFSQGGTELEVEVPGRMAVNDSNVYVQACLSGLGIGQVPASWLEVVPPGELVPVLTDWQQEAVPVHAVFPSHRHLSTRVQAFVEWTAEFFAARRGVAWPHAGPLAGR